MQDTYASVFSSSVFIKTFNVLQLEYFTTAMLFKFYFHVRFFMQVENVSLVIIALLDKVMLKQCFYQTLYYLVDNSPKTARFPGSA